MRHELEAVLRVQSLDLRIAELEKEIAALPRHIAEIEKALEVHNRRLEADRAALAANQRDRKRLEDDNKVQEQKVAKLRDQMMQAKTNEQYRAFQHEIEYCQNEIRKGEDRILDLMSEAEPLEANVRRAELSLTKEREDVEREKARVRDRSAEDKRFLAEARAERGNLFTTLSDRTAKAYDRISRKWKGLAVADATDGRCGACNISLRPQYYQDLKTSDRLMFCESCGRILYYKPAVDLEHEMHAPR
ncbi:MAG TPA: C4-type zinc ribbon domain-containing protein [Bryobacteraceae bacterium]|nr:C4-type zinc ribbon domain-containing protein [Bryobacteraceae bacterium]